MTDSYRTRLVDRLASEGSPVAIEAAGEMEKMMMEIAALQVRLDKLQELNGPLDAETNKWLREQFEKGWRERD